MPALPILCDHHTMYQGRLKLAGGGKSVLSVVEVHVALTFGSFGELNNDRSAKSLAALYYRGYFYLHLRRNGIRLNDTIMLSSSSSSSSSSFSLKVTWTCELATLPVRPRLFSDQLDSVTQGPGHTAVPTWPLTIESLFPEKLTLAFCVTEHHLLLTVLYCTSMYFAACTYLADGRSQVCGWSVTVDLESAKW